MKKVFIYAFFLLEIGCVTTAITPPKTFIDQGIWSNKSKDEVFNACLTALQMEGFGIHPLGVNKESGIIIPEEVRFYPQGYRLIEGYYKLQILVSELPDNKVMVDIQTKAGWRKADPAAWGYNEEDVRNRVNNRLAEDLERFFTRLDTLLGKAEYQKVDRLVWE